MTATTNPITIEGAGIDYPLQDGLIIQLSEPQNMVTYDLSSQNRGLLYSIQENGVETAYITLEEKSAETTIDQWIKNSPHIGEVHNMAMIDDSRRLFTAYQYDLPVDHYLIDTGETIIHVGTRTNTGSEQLMELVNTLLISDTFQYEPPTQSADIPYTQTKEQSPLDDQFSVASADKQYTAKFTSYTEQAPPDWQSIFPVLSHHTIVVAKQGIDTPIYIKEVTSRGGLGQYYWTPMHFTNTHLYLQQIAIADGCSHKTYAKSMIEAINLEDGTSLFHFTQKEGDNPAYSGSYMAMNTNDSLITLNLLTELESHIPLPVHLQTRDIGRLTWLDETKIEITSYESISLTNNCGADEQQEVIDLDAY